MFRVDFHQHTHTQNILSFIISVIIGQYVIMVQIILEHEYMMLVLLLTIEENFPTNGNNIVKYIQFSGVIIIIMSGVDVIMLRC